MGWSSNEIYCFGSFEKHMSQYNWENETVKNVLLDYAVVNRSTVYAAIELTKKDTGIKRVWALIILFTFNRKEYAWKEMDETCGPYEILCPKRILKLLTPTTSEYALKWRKNCWDHINNSDFKMEPGLVLIKGSMNNAIILDEKQKWSKQRWSCHSPENPSRLMSVTKRWLTLHGYTTQEKLFDTLL